MWNAIKVITNPRLDEYVMNDEEKETIRRALSKNPKNSLTNSEWMLRAVKSVREITNDTKADIYEVAAEPGVNYIKRLGLDMVEGVADDVDKVAATTACLFLVSSMVLPPSQNPMAVVAVITNSPRRRTTRMTSPSPEDVIRWPRLCMHRGTGLGEGKQMGYWKVVVLYEFVCP